MKIKLLLLLTFIFYSVQINAADLKLLKEKSFSISAGKLLILETDGGDVEITPWDKNEVYIKIWGNETAEEKMEFTLNSNNDKVEIIGERKSKLSWFSNIKLRYEIKLPASFNTNVSTSGGDIKFAGIDGNSELRTSGGDVWGDRFKGDFHANTSGGDINLFSMDSKISAKTSGGDIQLEYSGPNKGIELKTSGGDISIKVSPDFNASIELKTSGGDVSCEFKLNNVEKMKETLIIGDINNGGLPLKAFTSGGDIDLIHK